MKTREPGQVRKEAALSGHLQAPREHRTGVAIRRPRPGYRPRRRVHGPPWAAPGARHPWGRATPSGRGTRPHGRQAKPGPSPIPPPRPPRLRRRPSPRRGRRRRHRNRSATAVAPEERRDRLLTGGRPVELQRCDERSLCRASRLRRRGTLCGEKWPAKRGRRCFHARAKIVVVLAGAVIVDSVHDDDGQPVADVLGHPGAESEGSLVADVPDLGEQARRQMARRARVPDLGQRRDDRSVVLVADARADELVAVKSSVLRRPEGSSPCRRECASDGPLEAAHWCRR